MSRYCSSDQSIMITCLLLYLRIINIAYKTKMEDEISDVVLQPTLGRRHFLKLHERIQTKYQQMQKRLEKSRSVDSLSTISDDFSFCEPKYSSHCDLRESDEIASEIEGFNAIRQTLVEEKVNKQTAVSKIIEYIDVSISESEVHQNTTCEITEHEWEKIENDSVNTRVSLESLNEIGKYSDDNNIQAATSPRTLRDRIEFRLQAVRERREQRRREKERQAKEKQLKEKKESREKVEKFILSNSAKDIPQTKPGRKNKLATVTIALIDVTNLEPTVDERPRFLQCRFRLGNEKYKSKIAKSNNGLAKWQQLFNFNLFEDQGMLETTLWDKDISLGRNVIDLSELKKEKTHKLKIDLDGDVSKARVFMLLTICGMPLLNTVNDIDDVNNAKKELDAKKDAWYRLEKNFSEVGWLSVIVYGAKGLAAQDCYCVVKLTNERIHTHTEYKTNDPSWMKIFTFKLNDITSILEISVVEERKAEEIGKISIPLLRIKNGAKVWYALKDQTQRERAKGNNPRILLEMWTAWHLTRAAIRVINPKEPDLLATSAKVDRRVFARNIVRAKAVVDWTLDTVKFIKTCFEWEGRELNAIALFIWIVFCYFFKIWMLPLLFLIPFIRYRPEKYYLVNWKNLLNNSNEESKALVKVEKEEKSSLRQRINTLQEMIQTVQNGIGKFASIGESVKNLCNFTVPFVSLFAVFLILLMSLIMYIIPLKYILICYGIHKFTRKILRPNRIPNSEILDLLSRVPDDDTLLNCEELPLENNYEDSI